MVRMVFAQTAGGTCTIRHCGLPVQLLCCTHTLHLLLHDMDMFTLLAQAAAGGGAVSASSGAAAILSNVTVRGASATQQGAGGLQMRHMQRVELAGVLLSGNKVRPACGGFSVCRCARAGERAGLVRACVTPEVSCD